MTYYVYILQSQINQRFYFGHTQNLVQRLEKHNKGYSQSTKKFRPWILFAFKKVVSCSEAIALEKKLKNLKAQHRVFEFIESHGFNKPDGIENPLI